MAVFLSAGGGERTRRPPARIIPDPIVRAPTPRRPVSEGVGAALGDERRFVHKRIFGGIKGALGGILGGPGGILGGAIGGFAGGGRVPASAGAVGGFAGAVRGAVPGRCPDGFIRVGSFCVQSPIVGARPPVIPGRPVSAVPGAPLGFVDGAAAGAVDAGAGEAVMGRFGAGFEPEVLSTLTRRCGRGAVLGVDGICYNRRDLRNSERFWPRGRRPLLTGGDMRCISVASAAAKKLQRKQKQLTELGLLKRPPSRSRRAEPTHVRAAGVVHN